MIELTEQQVQAVEQAEQMPLVVNPKTREEFVLVRKEVFERMRKWMQPLNRGWDDPGAGRVRGVPQEAMNRGETAVRRASDSDTCFTFPLLILDPIRQIAESVGKNVASGAA